MSINEQLTIEEGKAILGGGLGRYELELVTSFCAPLYWAIRDAPRSVRSRNGTAVFLNAGNGLFGVTACHVIEGWRESRANEDAGPLRLAGNGISVLVDVDRAMIAMNPEIDVATFRVTESEVKALGKNILTGNQAAWPPAPPQERCGIYYCGYPGIGTLHPSPREAVFGACAGSGIAHSVSERDVSTQIEREYLIPALGQGIPPENFDYGGVSGGAMLTVIQNRLRSWSLAGIIYQGPNISADENQAIAGFEFIRARRAHFILPDGQLDLARWRSLSL